MFSELRTKKASEIQRFRDFMLLGQKKTTFFMLFGCFRSSGQQKMVLLCFRSSGQKPLEIQCFRDFVVLGQNKNSTSSSSSTSGTSSTIATSSTSSTSSTSCSSSSRLYPLVTHLIFHPQSSHQDGK